MAPGKMAFYIDGDDIDSYRLKIGNGGGRSSSRRRTCRASVKWLCSRILMAARSVSGNNRDNWEATLHYLLFYDVVHDYTTRRTPFRSAHLDYAQPFVERGELILGGALADPADAAILLFQAASPAVAEAFARADPYVMNGVVMRWWVREWTTVVGPLAAVPIPAGSR